MKSLPKIRLPFLMLVLGSAALTVAAGMMLFSTFMLYDDEGYVLFSIRNFAEHGRLYSDVYTQYGPFSYVFYYVLHLCGMPLTHTAGRLLTLGAWSGSATVCAWMVYRATKHSACMLAALSAGFIYLWIMVSEPNHPGGLIVFTTALLAAFGYRWLSEGRWTAWAIIAGAGSAVLLLTKINIGVFATLSSVALLLLHCRSDRLRTWTPWLIAGGLMVLPFALMRPLLSAPWVQTYALVFAFAAIPVAGALSRETGPHGGSRQWLAAVLAGCAVFLGVLGVIFSRGTSPSDLLQGVILGPLRHPGHFSFPFRWQPGVMGWASASFGLFLLVLAGLRFGRPGRLSIDTVVASLRLVAGVGLAFVIWQFPDASPDRLVFGFSLPFLWIFLWPLQGEEASTVIARSWLGLLFLGQWLHPFPVPGSQIAWGSFLVIPLTVISAWQAAVWLTERHGRLFTYARTQALDLTLTFALVAVAVLSGNRVAQIGTRYLASRPLDLPGAETVRVPDGTTAIYRTLVFNANAHGDMLFSLPGMFSFNLWSDLPAPTYTNVTHWFSLIDETKQRAIIEVLERHPRACVIVQAEHLEVLRLSKLPLGGPLFDYVMKEFEPAFMIDGFQFCVHRGRKVAPLLTAEIFQQKAAAEAGPAAAVPNSMVKLALLLPPDQQVASIEIARMDDRQIPPLVLNRDNARVEITPIDLEGRPRGQTAAAAFPFALQGAAEVAVYFDRGGRGFSTGKDFLVVRNAAGAELALVRLRP